MLLGMRLCYPIEEHSHTDDIGSSAKDRYLWYKDCDKIEKKEELDCDKWKREVLIKEKGGKITFAFEFVFAK